MHDTHKQRFCQIFQLKTSRKGKKKNRGKIKILPPNQWGQKRQSAGAAQHTQPTPTLGLEVHLLKWLPAAVALRGKKKTTHKNTQRTEWESCVSFPTWIQNIFPGISFKIVFFFSPLKSKDAPSEQVACQQFLLTHGQLISCVDFNQATSVGLRFEIRV